MRDDEPPAWHRHKSLSQRHIGLDLAAPLAGLACSNGGHLGPHQRAVHRKKPKHQRGLVIAAAAQNLVQKTARQSGLAVRQQINIGEGQLACHICPAQVFVKFDAVKQPYLLTDQDQVRQMQVAVALTHPASALARCHHGAKLTELQLGPGTQSRQPD